MFLFKSYRLCTINAQTVFFMLCQHMFTTKTLKTTLAKEVFVFILCFVKHKSVKIFDAHIMQFITINYKQQIYRVFKYLIWNVNWKCQFVFITKHVNANIVLFFNLAKIFFSHRKPNPIIIKIINKFFTLPCNSFWMYFYRINMPNMTLKKTFLIVFVVVD